MDRSQLLRGALDGAVLAVTAEEDAYGYDVLRRLRAAGLAEVGDASVYGSLRRLYSAGALTSYMVPSEEALLAATTASRTGRDQLEQARTVWHDFSRALGALPETKVEART
jgi:PadR family transcriptional regulator PadR